MPKISERYNYSGIDLSVSVDTAVECYNLETAAEGHRIVMKHLARAEEEFEALQEDLTQQEEQ